MYRILFLIIFVCATFFFGWWIFVPLSLLYIYLAKSPYEIIPLGFIFDNIYYASKDFIFGYPLSFLAVFLILGSLFISSRIHWEKKI